jgi:DNA-binding NarL/FixJ family response regulator
MTTPAGAITVVLVDDHDLVREGVKGVIESDSQLVVVGEAGDSAGAIAVISDKHPEVVLLDVEMPGEDVTATVRRVHQVSPSSQIIILSMHDGPHLLRNLLEAGIQGYLLKSASGEELRSAIHGTREMDGRVRLLVSSSSLVTVQSGAGPARVSEQERQVLQLVAEAFSNVQIGHQLGLTESAVKRHLRSIFKKLGAVSRIDAVNKGVASSLITAPRSTPI